jgi:hypothetical protein
MPSAATRILDEPKRLGLSHAASLEVQPTPRGFLPLFLPCGFSHAGLSLRGTISMRLNLSAPMWAGFAALV